MTKFELFKKLYLEDSFYVISHRVSKQSLMYNIKDEKFVDEVLSKLFIECPSKFPGEYKNEKHYLLKPFWEILHEFSIMLLLCNGTKSINVWIKHIWIFIQYIIFLPSDKRYYMHPTAISRHGRFFLTPKINF